MEEACQKLTKSNSQKKKKSKKKKKKNKPYSLHPWKNRNYISGLSHWGKKKLKGVRRGKPTASHPRSETPGALGRRDWESQEANPLPRTVLSASVRITGTGVLAVGWVVKNRLCTERPNPRMFRTPVCKRMDSYRLALSRDLYATAKYLLQTVLWIYLSR